jgi:hypothetical protein
MTILLKQRHSQLKASVHIARLAACAGLAGAFLTGAPAWSAQKASVPNEASREIVAPNTPPNGVNGTPHLVELVVVYGFRLRSTQHDMRVQSIREGYAELIGKPECLQSICGFVVLPDGAKWRSTNVLAGTESSLTQLKRDMEREGTTLVIVHPTGTKRTIPNF